jgi:hypothetical protein
MEYRILGPFSPVSKTESSSRVSIPEQAFIATAAIVEAKLAEIHRRVYQDHQRVKETVACSRTVRQMAREAVQESRLARARADRLGQLDAGAGGRHEAGVDPHQTEYPAPR